MKLMGCYIAGFGCLREKNLEFDRELTCVFQENGTGKTTLAAFLKAMLFGMASYKSNSRGFEDRRHYRPFDGGAFGGSLTLEYGGKVYCITRRFDEKSDAKDRMEVTRDGRVTRDLGEDPGRTIFGLGRDSFERTAFLTADPGEMAATDGIAGRLQSLVDNNRGEQDFRKAWDALDAAARRLQGLRGQSGRIEQQKNRIRELESQVRQRQTLEAAVAQNYDRLEALERGIRRDRQRWDRAREQQVLWARWSGFRRLEGEALRKEEAAARLRARCGTVLPDESQRQALETARERMVQLRGHLAYAGMPREREAQLADLERRYPRGIPEEKTLDTIQALWQKCREAPSLPAPSRGWAAILGLGLALALAGAAVTAFRPGLGGALLGLGLAGVAAAWLTARRGRIRRRLAREQYEKDREALEARLASLLEPYGLRAWDPQLRADGLRLEDLGQERAQALRRQQSLREEYRRELARVEGIFDGCGMALSREPERDIDTWLHDLERLALASGEAAQARRGAEEYRREWGLTDPPETAGEELSALEEDLARRQRQLSRLEQQLRQDEDRLEDLADCCLQLQEAKEELGALQKRYAMVTAARDCLSRGQEALKQRHLHPVTSRFDHYAGLLREDLGARLALDGDFRLYGKDKGAEHPQQHLSAGQKAAAALCLRLALLDSLYPGDKPPLILDDPFAFLDEEQLEKAKALVRTLSKERQILYFTCHESRKI